MALSLSERSARISKAEIRNMTVECERMGGINLAQGVCDLGVPPIVAAAAKQAMDEGCNCYTRHDGITELREAIAGKLGRFNGIQADPETQITVSAGTTGALYCACLALLNPGDEVVLFEPYYGYHINTLLAADAVPRLVTTTAPDWNIERSALERAITPRTKAILLCTPGNPTGKVLSQAELEIIADIANRHDLFVFSDEIYEYFVYEGRHISPATLPGMAHRTITISGYSKTFSITGWRIGYSVADPRWAEMIGYVSDLVYVCAPAPLQKGVAAGIAGLPESFYVDLREEFRGKRELLCGALARVGLTPSVPKGAYYVLADSSRLPGRTGKERAMHLLKTTGVASVPGEAFHDGGRGAGLLRFCFAKSPADIEQACQRLSQLQK